MDGRQFDAWTRQTAKALSRRSLLTLSGAALVGAVAGPSVAAVGKCGKKSRRKCQKQVSKCEDVVRAFCIDVDGGMGCLQRLFACCAPLEVCDSAASTQCFIDELSLG